MRPIPERWRVSLTAVLMMVVAVSASGQRATMNRDIAAIHVASAADAIAAGDDERAEALLNRAVETDSSFSDPRYLLATIASETQVRTSEAIDLLRTALVLGAWSRYSFDEASVLLAELYVRTGQNFDALEVLSAVDTATPLFPESLLARVLLARIEALRGEERIDEADNELVRARDRFPDDPAFFLIELSDEPIPSLRYRDELNRLLRVSSEPGDALLAALLVYAETAPTQSESEWAADQYEELGGRYPAIALARRRFVPTGSIDSFLALGGVSHPDLIARLGDLDPDEQEQIDAAVAAYSGVATVDADRDGWYEERMDVSSGVVMRWDVDRNEDGQNEASVSFGRTLPASVSVTTDSGDSLVRYDRYPYVQSVELPRLGGAERLILRPRATTFMVVNGIPADGPRYGAGMSISAPLPVFDLLAAERATTVTEELDADGLVRERRYLEEGVVVRVADDSDGDGRWDYLVVMDDGLPAAAVRDLDGDGYFEVSEGYERGRLVIRAIDENDNGTPEIVERRDESSRNWDVNEDGEIDIREFTSWVDEVLGEFGFLELNR